VNPGLPLGPNAITGDEYLRVELAAVRLAPQSSGWTADKIKNL
jgi:hypothetical protein